MPTAPSTLDLAEAVERNFIESWLLLARLDPETQPLEENGVRGFISGSTSPLLNGIVETRIPSDGSVDSTIDAVIARFAEHSVPATWWILPSTQPADLGERLASRGLIYGGSMPGMAMDLGDLEAGDPGDAEHAQRLRPSPPTGFSIEPVRTETALAAFLSVAMPALDAPDDFGTIFARTVLAVGFGPERIVRNYLGRIDGRPVATSSLITGGGIAGIYNVATEATHRRRGLGGAMTLAALDDARALGIHVAVLQSTELGHSMYEALGFRDVCSIHLHVLEAPGSPSG